MSCLIYWQFRERYTRIHAGGGPQNAVLRSRENAHKRSGRSRRVADTDSEDEDEDCQNGVVTRNLGNDCCDADSEEDMTRSDDEVYH